MERICIQYYTVLVYTDPDLPAHSTGSHELLVHSCSGRNSNACDLCETLGHGLQHCRPLGAHRQPVAGVLHVTAGDGVGGDVVRAEDGRPHLELAVGGVGVQPGLQTCLAQGLNRTCSYA